MMTFIFVFLATSIASITILKVAQKIKQAKKEQRMEKIQTLHTIQKEFNKYKYQEYLERAWIEQYLYDIEEIIQKDKKILKELDPKTLPDIIAIIKDKEEGVAQLQDAFIQQELKSYGDFFNTLEEHPLTPMQRLAVITHEENNLILAGAGSGKTSVILAKVAYLLEKNYADPSEILILSFNKKAQEELMERTKKLGVEINIKTFHALGRDIVMQCYEVAEEMSFDEMISLATQAIQEGDYLSPYLYLLVDEFQDISEDRNQLLLALKEQNDANLTAVGDDWQAINAFAGSDISLIQNFQDIYGYTKVIKLDYTFRFNQEIADLSQKFILKNPQQIDKEIKTIKESNTPSLYLYQYNKTEEIDQAISTILQLINNKTEKEKSVMILSRYGFQKPKNIEALQAQFPTLRLHSSTIHASKGLEADYIILSHLKSGKFGFPSEIEEKRDEFLYAEERRLFYVAMTRAKEKIFFVTHKKKPSSFMEEIMVEGSFVGMN